ncbi:hypothetical protein LCGC14_1235680, partial [marine sediment metagenome]|nr:hypothetical protein [Pricia sp.]
MNLSNRNLKFKYSIYLLFTIISIGATNRILAYTHATLLPASESPNIARQLELYSYSFTAQERSSFSVGDVSEQTERGLTLIHFNTSEKIEYRTFDTHSSAEAAIELVAILKRMIDNKAKFAMLVHDSAAQNLNGQTAALLEMSFVKLSSIKNRQAYVMHNLDGLISEEVDDSSIAEIVTVPAKISDNTIYFPKIKYEFEPSID